MNTNDLTDCAEHQLITPMTQEEAREYTEQIRRDLEGIKSTPQRLLSMEQRQGFLALDYATWREWAKNEYPQHSQGYLYRLLSAAKAKVNLDQDSTIVEIDIPVSHLYQLSRLPNDQQTFAYHRANELAASEQRSRIARHVKDAVDKMLPPKPTKVKDINNEANTEDEEHDVADDDTELDNETDVLDSSKSDNSNYDFSPHDPEFDSERSHFNQPYAEDNHELNDESVESGDSKKSASAASMSFTINNPDYGTSPVDSEVEPSRSHFNQSGSLDESDPFDQCAEFGDSSVSAPAASVDFFNNDVETAYSSLEPKVETARLGVDDTIPQPDSKVLSAVETCLEEFSVPQNPDEQLTGKVCVIQTGAAAGTSAQASELVTAYDQGTVTEAIALVPLEEQIFVEFAEQTICPLPGNTVAVYFGRQIDKFVSCFRDLGKAWHQYSCPTNSESSPSGSNSAKGNDFSGQWLEANLAT